MAEKELLHGDGIGAVLGDESHHVIVDLPQAGLKGELRGGGNGAVFHQRKADIIVIHQAHAHDGIARIDAHDTHA